MKVNIVYIEGKYFMGWRNTKWSDKINILNSSIKSKCKYIRKVQSPVEWS